MTEPELPSPLMWTRKIRACEGDAAAQLLLEHYALQVSRLALEEAARVCDRNIDGVRAGEGRKDEAEERAWLPIETAPKDGTEVLLYAPATVHDGMPVGARRTYGHWLKPSDIPRIKYQDGFAPEEEWDDFEPHWMSWDGGFTEEHPPTHWMPVPEAPASSPDTLKPPL